MWDIDKYVKTNEQCSKPKSMMVLPNTYPCEIDTSEELGPQEALYCQSLIGIACWVVELGRVNIYTEVSMLPLQIALARQRRLEAFFRMFFVSQEASQCRDGLGA